VGSPSSKSPSRAEGAAHTSEMWEKFGDALGLRAEAIRLAPANAAGKRACEARRRAWRHGDAAAGGWALEQQTAGGGRGQARRLSAFYRISPGEGGQYFSVHEHLDVEHSAELRALCSEGPCSSQPEMLRHSGTC